MYAQRMSRLWKFKKDGDDDWVKACTTADCNKKDSEA